MRSPIRRALTAALTGLTMLCLAAPAGAADAPRSFYGFFSDDSSIVDGDVLRGTLDRQKATGVGVLREHVFWDRIERTPYSYDFSSFDHVVREAAARGITILPIITHPPGFHSSRPAGSTDPRSYPPRDPSSMALFAHRFVQRYGPAGDLWCTGGVKVGRKRIGGTCRADAKPITAIQVWNEPDQRGWWLPEPDPAAYVRLLAVTSLAIKAADNKMEVVMAGISSHGVNDGFLQELYNQNVQTWTDSAAIHPYGSTIKEMFGHIGVMRKIMSAKGDKSPIRVTEYGWASAGRGANQVVSEPCQAALLHAATRQLAYRRTWFGISSISQFMWNDRSSATNDIWPLHAGLIRSDGSAKPALGAFTEAVAGRPAPSGLTLDAACPVERRAL